MVVVVAALFVVSAPLMYAAAVTTWGAKIQLRNEVAILGNGESN